MEGKHLGAFHVEEKLGAGGMGTVYRARVTRPHLDLEEGSQVALKIIHAHLIALGDYFERFLREAEVGARVRHENVVRVYGLETGEFGDDELTYIVMEYVTGRTLRELRQDLGTVPDSFIREIALQVAAGLLAIHAEGVVHRDIKPENVLLTHDDEIRIMDLGLAKLVEESVELTKTGNFAGSVGYAAPEQCDVGPVGPASDLYSLGVVLLELATGWNPFRRESPLATMMAQMEVVPRPARELNAEISPFLSDLVAALLRKDVATRMHSAALLFRTVARGEHSEWWEDRERARVHDEIRRPEVPVRRGTKMYGRDHALRTLRDAWSRAQAGEGCAVFLEGEAGIGKSRLVDEFLRSACAAGVRTMYGCYPPHDGRGGLSDAIRREFGDADLETKVRPYLDVVADLVPAFAAASRRDALPAGASPLANDALEAVMCHLLRGLAAEKPLVWVVDDLHLAEPVSRRTVTSMVRAAAGHPVLLLLTSRPELPEKEVELLTSLENLTSVRLERLGSDEVYDLLRETLQSDGLTLRLGAKIAAKSDGIPYFVIEMVRGLFETGQIKLGPDGVGVESGVIERIEVPSAIRDLIEVRLRDLSDDDRRLLDVAAVIGFTFDPDLVARVLERKKVRVLERLAALERRSGVVHSLEGAMSFDHHQIQEVLYADLREDLRAEYHALVADAIAAVGAGPAAGEMGDLDHAVASHHLKGARPEAALPHLLDALDRLADSYRHDALLDLADRALACEGMLTGETREKVLHRKASSLDLLGRREEEQEVLEEIVRLADESREGGRQVHARRRLGWNLLCLSRPEEARTELEQAAALAVEIGDRVGLGLATLSLGNVHWSLGNYGESREHHETALEIAADLRDPRMEGRAHGNLGNVARLEGRFDVARAHFERAVKVFREIGDRVNEGAALGNLGNVDGDLGLLMAAREHHQAAIAIAREIGDRTHEAVALLNQGAHRILLGDLSGAEGTLETAQRILVEIGARMYLAYVLHLRGEAAAATDRPDEARRRYDDALYIFRKVQHPSGISTVLPSLGRLQESLGETTPARDSYMEALGCALDIEEPTAIVTARGHLAALGVDDPADAAAALEVHAPRLGRPATMRARYLLFVATGDRTHLGEARRLLEHIRDHAPEEDRGPMMENVELHRRILEG